MGGNQASMIRQRTLKNIIRATGVGFHTGEKIYLTLRPSPVDSGVVFRRVDLVPPVKINASLENVKDTTSSTTIEKVGAEVASVEHILSACAGLGIDNAMIDLSAPEVPMMDGSAGPFVFLIQSAGIAEQDAQKRYIRIKKPVKVVRDGKWAKLDPFNGFKVSFTVDFAAQGGINRTQELCVDFSRTSFVKEISRARNLAARPGLIRLSDRKMAQGDVLCDAGDNGNMDIPEQDGLRYEDEFIKHRILAATGDLKLLEHSVIGAYSAYQSGHALNHQLMRKLLDDRDAWEIVVFSSDAKKLQKVNLRSVSSG